MPKLKGLTVHFTGPDNQSMSSRVQSSPSSRLAKQFYWDRMGVCPIQTRYNFWADILHCFNAVLVLAKLSDQKNFYKSTVAQMDTMFTSFCMKKNRNKSSFPLMGKCMTVEGNCTSAMFISLIGKRKMALGSV